MSMFIRQLLIHQALKRQSPQPSLAPTARYRAYDMTNDSEGKEILKDLTGNGHDIQLKNFLFAEGSGYGKYVYDFSDINIFTNLLNGTRGEGEVRSDIITVSKINQNIPFFEFKSSVKETKSFKIKVTGLKDGEVLTYASDADLQNKIVIKTDGNYTLPSKNYIYYGFRLKNASSTFPFDCNITIEQIPDYKGALVSDGVDDYGICENFPIFTKEKGYTVVALRKWLTLGNQSCLVSKESENNDRGEFTIEYTMPESSNSLAYSYGSTTGIVINNNSLFSYQTSINYNGNVINKGIREPYEGLVLFKKRLNAGTYANVALYALDIYDRDLTDEEIEKVKAEMIAEYEEKTGEKYVEQ